MVVFRVEWAVGIYWGGGSATLRGPSAPSDADRDNYRIKGSIIGVSFLEEVILCFFRVEGAMGLYYGAASPPPGGRRPPSDVKWEMSRILGYECMDV